MPFRPYHSEPNYETNKGTDFRQNYHWAARQLHVCNLQIALPMIVPYYKTNGMLSLWPKHSKLPFRLKKKSTTVIKDLYFPINQDSPVSSSAGWVFSCLSSNKC